MCRRVGAEGVTFFSACGQLELKYEAEYLKSDAPQPERGTSLPDKPSQLPAAPSSESSEEEYRERQERRMERAMLRASAGARQVVHRREQGGAREEGQDVREPGVEHRRRVVCCCFFVRALDFLLGLAVQGVWRNVAYCTRCLVVLPCCACACSVDGRCLWASVHYCVLPLCLCASVL